MPTDGFYNGGLDDFGKGNIAWLTDTIKVALVADTYTPDLVTHDFWDDVVAHLVNTPATLASKTVSGGGIFDAADVVFVAPVIGSVVKYFVVFKDTGVAATSRLILCIETATYMPRATDGTNMQIIFNASGIARL